MKKILSILLFPLLISSCNDGDIILTSFDFGSSTLEICEGSSGYVFFKINDQAAESLSLNLGTTEMLFMESDTTTYILDGSLNYVNYRQFSDVVTSSYFCSNIPPTTPNVTVEYIGSSGNAILTTITVLNDQDGISSEIEGQIDTDLDGLLDFYDFDDDGDNVPTIVEIGPDFENPQDSDGDGILDYLDTDDDNDGILTRYEDSDGNLDPTNDITDPSIGPDYLNSAVQNKTIIDEYREHSYNLNSDITLILNNLVLTNENEQITEETLDMGQILDVVDMAILVTPKFL